MKNLLKNVVASVLQAEARLVLKKYKPKIVAVTGSVGKTSTKDAIYTALSTTYFVRKSSKSFNNEIGIPLTILGLPSGWNDPSAWLKNILDGFLLILLPHKYPEWLVVEIGADRPGDIAVITKWLTPDVAVVTRLSEVPVHVEFFASAEHVRHEKSELVRAAREKSIVILNADDKLVLSMRNVTKGKVYTYGAVHPADVSARQFEIAYDSENGMFPTGIKYLAQAAGKEFPVMVRNTVGRQQMYTTLAAITVAHALGLDMKKVTEAMKNHETPPGRMKLLRGVHNSCVIDDTYNSSPIAAHEALDALSLIRMSAANTGTSTGRKIAVLGDMLELGSYSSNEHAKLGIKAASIADEIYTVGPRARAIADAALSQGFSKEKIHTFADSVTAGEALVETLRSGDIVLVKGSQGMRMEKTVEKILFESGRATDLLVRQDEEWKQS